MKLCVTEAVRDGRRVVGIFEWVGKSWHTATLVQLIKELPSDASQKVRMAEYKKAKQELNAS
jgi:hypothetical protein